MNLEIRPENYIKNLSQIIFSLCASADPTMSAEKNFQQQEAIKIS